MFPLLRALGDPDEEVRRWARRALRSIGSKDNVWHRINRLDDPEKREAIARELGAPGGVSEMVAGLQQALKGCDARARSWLAWILSTLGVSAWGAWKYWKTEVSYELYYQERVRKDARIEIRKMVKREALKMGNGQ